MSERFEELLGLISFSRKLIFLLSTSGAAEQFPLSALILDINLISLEIGKPISFSTEL